MNIFDSLALRVFNYWVPCVLVFLSAVGGWCNPIINNQSYSHEVYSHYAIEGSEGLVTFSSSPVSKSGGQSAMIQVAPEAPTSFYTSYWDITSVSKEALYEVTAWIRTDSVEGIGAHLSLVTLASEPPHERISSQESERVTGSQDWTLVRTIVFVPADISTIRLTLLLHGQGTAWFDQVHVREIKQFSSVTNAEEVRVQLTDVATTPEFLGFGVEDDPFFFTDENFRYDITIHDLEIRNHRIMELNPSLVCTLFWWDSIAPDKDLTHITYETELMEAMIKTLKPHQQAGRKVFMGDVHWGWTPAEFVYNATNVEKGVAEYVRMLDYLINEHGLDCIRYVAIAGEVDMIFDKLGGSYETYLTAVRALRKGLDQAGLHQVQIIGDKTGGLVWFRRALADLGNEFGILAVHEYPDVRQYPIIHDRLESALEAIRSSTAPAGDAAASAQAKPAFLYEIGYRDLLHESNLNSNGPLGVAMLKPEYGLLCAYTCNVSMNQGFVGGSVWCLHSMYYAYQNLMDFGIWEWKDQDWKLRPIYYAYGLYTRFAKPDMVPVQTQLHPSNLYDLSVSAMQTKDGQQTQVFLLNLSDQSVDIRLDELPSGDYQVYLYHADHLPEPGDWGYGQIEALRQPDIWNSASEIFQIPAQALVLLRPR